MKFLQISVLIFITSFFVNAQTSPKAILSGNIYDENGSLIVNAKITAINEKGENFETLTNKVGMYVLNLPFNFYRSSNDFKIAKFDIAVTKEGFEKTFIKNFKFVPSSEGKMNLDIALDVQPIVDTINIDSIKNKNNKENN